MRRIMIASVIMFVVLAILPLMAQEESQESALSVDQMEICVAVEEREPVGADTAFSSTMDRLYCFTAISGAEDTTTISHVWYHGDDEKATVELSVKGKKWRTWSSKRIVEEWTGTWRVDVVSTAGKVLKSKEFVVE